MKLLFITNYYPPSDHNQTMLPGTLAQRSRRAPDRVFLELCQP